MSQPASNKMGNSKLAIRKPMDRFHPWAAWLWLIILIGALFYLVQRVTLPAEHQPAFFDSNIMSLLPVNERDKGMEQALQQVAENFGQRVVVVVAHPDRDAALRGARRVESAVVELLELDKSVQVDEKNLLSLGKLYGDFIGALLAPKDKAYISAGDATPLLNQVLMQLYNPVSGINSAQLEFDPLLLQNRFLQSLASPGGKLKPDNGLLVYQAEGVVYAVQFFKATQSVYHLTYQAQVKTILDSLELELKQSDARFRLLKTGALFFAEAGVQSARKDISTVGLGSLIAIVVLIGVVFRSLRPIGLSVLAIGIGCFSGVVCVVLVFGQVHIMALAFGASLVGVAIDYSFHYFGEHLSQRRYQLKSKNNDRLRTLKPILAAISLGLVSSLMAYSALLWAPFPGLHQIALLSGVGLVAAYLTVMLWFPYLYSTALSEADTDQLLSAVSRGVSWIQRQRMTLRVMLGLLLLLSIAGLAQLPVTDDVRLLQQLSVDLKQQELEIADVTGARQNQPFLLLRAGSEQALLAHEEKLREVLQIAEQQGFLESVVAVSKYLPSLQMQQENRNQLLALLQSNAEKLEQFQADIGTKWHWAQSYSAGAETLTPQHLIEPGLAFLKPLWLGSLEPAQYYSVILLVGLQNEQQLRALFSEHGFAKHPDVVWINQAQEVTAVFQRYRQAAIYLLLAAYVGISLLLLWRYSLGRALQLAAVPASAALFALGGLGWLGIPFNIFALLAAVLVIGIAIDYTLFFAEAGERRASTLLAVGLSACTTILAFGLLCLSGTQALATFGTVMLLGITYGFLAAPIWISATTPAAIKTHTGT